MPSVCRILDTKQDSGLKDKSKVEIGGNRLRLFKQQQSNNNSVLDCNESLDKSHNKIDSNFKKERELSFS